MSGKVAKPAKAGPSSFTKMYLVVYNLAAALGWAYVAYTTYTSFLFGDNGLTVTPSELFAKLTPALQISQTLAVLEIVHAALKIVPSALFTTFVQVMSRIIVLWGYTVPVAHQHWSIYLLTASWATTEIPRYLFYVWQLLFPTTPAPYPLFWLRYSLFAILYPTGITGEILQLWNSLSYYKEVMPVFRIISLVVLFVLYPPGSPFMYMHMVTMRKGQFKKRKAAEDAAKGIVPAPKPVEGLIFPVDPTTGVASTSDVGKTVLSAATAVASKASAESIKNERNWRFKYAPHFVEHVRLACQSKANAVAMSEAGLAACYNTFQFVRDGQTMSLEAAMKKYTGTYQTATFTGKATSPNKTIGITYKGQQLVGDALKAQLNKWVEYGTIEPSCRDALMWIHTNKIDISDKWFVLLGAGAAMGPLELLLSIGANIVAVDLDRSGIWERILSKVEKSSSTVIFPVKSTPKSNSIADLAAVAGGNLFTHTPEIANFVSTVAPGKQLVIGSYAYLDSAAHVQVSLAMDAVVRTAIEKRGNENVSLGYLCSPTDVFEMNADTFEATKKNRAEAPFWQKLLVNKPLRNNGIAAKDENGNNIYICDGIVIDQGPNYALAKRIQHWRAVLEFTKGSIVSTNIAPSTATLSVVHNASFAAAYGGMKLFKPMEVMQPELSNSAMGALLLHDICNPASAKNPNSALGGQLSVAKPMLLFASGALHGGVWRLGYKMTTIGVVAAAAFYLSKYWYAPTAIIAGYGALISGVVPLP